MRVLENPPKIGWGPLVDDCSKCEAKLEVEFDDLWKKEQPQPPGWGYTSHWEPNAYFFICPLCHARTRVAYNTLGRNLAARVREYTK